MTRIAISAWETLAFGLILYFYRQPVGDPTNFYPLTSQLSDIPEIWFILVVGLITLIARFVCYSLHYYVWLTLLIAQQVVWTLAVFGFLIDYLNHPTAAPWALVLSFFVCVRNVDNIYVFVVLKQITDIETAKMNNLAKLKETISVTHETTVQVDANITEYHKVKAHREQQRNTRKENKNK